jgi:FtsP/CotA-like multicopper oxidase with cupredoxin domain
MQRSSATANISTSRAARWEISCADARARLARGARGAAHVGEARMDPTDLVDVSGYTYTYLMNGVTPAGNWSGEFRRGERIKLRFINGSSMSFFDVRIPGLAMTVVAADGQDVDAGERR